jgi:hypothetical protein
MAVTVSRRAMEPIEIFAGQQAYRHIAQSGIRPTDIRAIIGASGGPKWFVLSHLDRYLIQNWLPAIPHQLELIGSSIGAWRMAAYASAAPMAALEQLESQYLNQRYSARPSHQEISQSIRQLLDSFIQSNDLDQHQLKKLHIVAARCKGLSQLEQPSLQGLAFAAVAVGNLVSRRTLPRSFDRVIFQSPGGQLPVAQWDHFRTHQVPLNRANYRDALLASGAIPIVIEGVRDPVGAPAGLYRDGGMVDYHFDLPFKPQQGLVLYPHFSPLLKPGWFDKPLPWRKVQASNYSHTLMISPSREFVASLPYGKIPDRRDFERLDNDSRIRYWQTVVDRNQAIAEAFDRWVHSANPLDQVIPIETLAR